MARFTYPHTTIIGDQLAAEIAAALNVDPSDVFVAATTDDTTPVIAVTVDGDVDEQDVADVVAAHVPANDPPPAAPPTGAEWDAYKASMQAALADRDEVNAELLLMVLDLMGA